jgi:transcriptional regulator with XRE-family HTH domain
MSGFDDEDEVLSSPYSRKIGERLRSIRRQKRMSLQEVEAASEQEFKASVLGAYERGERAISVPRLERLARFYAVPVDQLLPRDEMHAGDDLELAGAGAKLVVDLVKLGRLTGGPFDMLQRFFRMIQVQRQDFNGKVLTVRADDRRAIAAMLDVPVDEVEARMDALDLLFRADG